MDYWLGKKTPEKNLKIPKLGFGTWQIKGEDCTSAVQKALEVGYRHIDTAQIYQNEEFVGKALNSSHIPREDLFIVTKAWKDFLDFKEILISTSKSLDKLKLDYIDLLLIHWPNPQFPIDETLSALKELIDTKKVKFIGLSNFTVSLMRKATKIYSDLICNQVEYHPFLSQKKVLKELKKNQMFLTAYCPLARGAVFKNSVLKSIAKKYNKYPGQVALKWLIDQDDVVAIPKSSKPKHIKSNFEIFDFELSEEDKKEIEALQKQEKRFVSPEWAPKWD